MSFRNLNAVRISPDGNEVLYLESKADFSSDDYEATLWRVAATGAPAIKLAASPLLAGINAKPAWSPDGRWISFLGTSEETGVQLFVIPASGGEARQLTHSATNIQSYDWSPDASAILYSAAREAAPREHDDILERNGGQGVSTQLWLQSLSGGEARRISPEPYSVVSFDWGPEGRRVAFSASASDDVGYMSMFRTGVHVLDIEHPDLGATTLVAPKGANWSPTWSPDGNWIAYTTSAGNESILSTFSLAIVSADGLRSRDLTRHTEQYVGELMWSPDGDGIFFIADPGQQVSRGRMFERQLFKTSLGGEIRQITAGEQVVSKLSISSDGSRLAYKASNAETMGDVHVQALPAEQSIVITDINPGTANLDWGKLDSISWRAPDGEEIWGLLLLPPAHEPEAGGRIPLIVYVHGGPIGSFLYGIYPQFTHGQAQGSPYPVRAWSSAGMAVLMPNPRGGHGYGEEGFRAILDGNLGKLDLADILSGVDHLIEAGIADPDFIGIAGGSYGGYMTNWAVTQTDRFRAASSWAGLSDYSTFYALSDAGDALTPYLGGLPWESTELYQARSPVFFSTNVQTPILIQHGASDYRVPAPQARQFFAFLDGQDKHACMEIYKQAGHVAPLPVTQRVIQQHNLEWFVYWLKDEKSSSDDRFCP